MSSVPALAMSLFETGSAPTEPKVKALLKRQQEGKQQRNTKKMLQHQGDPLMGVRKLAMICFWAQRLARRALTLAMRRAVDSWSRW